MADTKIRFRVNEGQQIAQLRPIAGQPGKMERVILKGGDIVEGAPFWLHEFAGRMTPIDLPQGVGAEDAAAVAAIASAKPHEQVSLLEQELARSEARNAALRDAIAAKRAEAEAEARSRAADKASHGHETDSLDVRKVGDASASVAGKK